MSLWVTLLLCCVGEEGICDEVDEECVDVSEMMKKGKEQDEKWETVFICTRSCWIQLSMEVYFICLLLAVKVEVVIFGTQLHSIQPIVYYVLGT